MVLDSTHQGLSNDVSTNFQLHVEVRKQDPCMRNGTEASSPKKIGYL